MTAVLGWLTSRRRERALRTALLDTQRQFAESELLFHAAFEQAGAGVAVVDMAGKTVRVNRRLAEIMGYSVAELSSLSLRAQANPDDLARVMQDRDRLLKGEIPILQGEHRYRHKLGHEVWASVTAAVVRDAQGAPQYFVSIIDDIQARKRAEAERLLFSEAFHQASLPLLLTDAVLSIRYANPAFCTLTGFSLQELEGRPLTSLVPEASQHVYAEALRRLPAEGTFASEADSPSRDGTPIPVQLSLSNIDDHAGATVGLVGSFRDLRASRAQESLLRKLALAVEQNPSFVIITTLDNQIDYVNDALVRASGYSRDELLRMKARQLTTGVTPEHVAAWAAAMAERRPWSGVVQNLRKDGSEYPVATTILPLVEPDGSVTHRVGLGEDVSERLRIASELERHRHNLEELVSARTDALHAANTSLAEQQRFLRTVTDAMPAIVGYVDAEGVYRFANQGYSRWYGVPNESLLGRSIYQTADAEALARNEPYIRAVLRGEPQLFQSTVPRHSDGSSRHMQSVFIPDQAEAGVRGFFVMATDITELKEAELKLAALNDELSVRAAQAEAATRAKSAFLANMSHEIRTPMNAILGLTHLLTLDATDRVQRDRLGKVHTAAKHLLHVINDILDLSKIEAGKMTLDADEFALDGLLASSFELVVERARQKGIELIVDTDHLPAYLRGDQTRLRQALVNLLGNAVKFTEHGWVRLRGELLREEATRVQVRFEVQDTGEGIALEAQPQLFTAFEQADSSISRRHGGTGLGLALTRHLVQLMDGEIGVQSTPGVGSKFWFTAWLGRARESGVAVIPLHGMRALVVDDLPEAAASVASRLSLMGLDVDTAPGGAEALGQATSALAAGRPYDVLLIDWRMAPLDGIETNRRLHALLRDAMPPSILFSAFDEPSLRQQARDAQFDAVLLKPITASALHDKLMLVLRGQSKDAFRSATASSSAEAELRERHAGRRVLLAEDNAINQEVAQALLQQVGLDVEVADDGRRAVELACSRPYDVVLMDVQMPLMDGLAAARAIRDALGHELPILAITANAFGEDRESCLAAGMNDHIAKPVDPEQLFRTLLRWLPAR
ncbi:MAG TPA: PAS domain S-box protein [Polyangiales bacterium]|nr:PAS domain S-box protein [Polyangiales bacterium]